MASPARSVLITGASSGSVGSALALSFATQGFTVFAGLRTVSKIDPSLSALPNVHVISLDVVSDESIAAAFDFVTSKTKGLLDCLVNNAGFTYTSPLVDTDMGTARKMFDVNFWAVLSMTKAFVPLLKNAKGTVVNVSSVGAIVHTPYLGELTKLVPAYLLWSKFSIDDAANGHARNLQRLQVSPYHRVRNSPSRTCTV